MTLDHRVLVKDTEQDLDSTPSLCWEKIEQEAERLLHQRINHGRRVRLDDTTVIVSVNNHSRHDLTKRFKRLIFEGTAINKQILMWQDLLHQPRPICGVRRYPGDS